MLIEKENLNNMKLRAPVSYQFSGRITNRFGESADYIVYDLLAMEDNFATRTLDNGREYFVVPEETWYGDGGISLRTMWNFNALVQYGENDALIGFGQEDPYGRVYW